jgi:Domain of unknown function (DUF4388)
VSLLGTLEQFRLPNVLQRLESHAKTGLLVVRQGVRWVEFYVRNGCLLCIGPVRTSATLVDRLLQDKVISQQVWQEMKRVLGSDEHSETRVAITLMERGDVTREQLRAWTTEKSLMVLSAVLAWTSGEIYFEESTQPPSDRLLVSMSITYLIETVNVDMPAPQPQPLKTTPVPSSLIKFKITQESPSPAVLPPLRSSTVRPTTSPLSFTKQPKPVQPKVDIARIPTLLGAEQFTDETSANTTSTSNVSFPDIASFASFLSGNNDSGVNLSLSNPGEISFASLVPSDASSENSALIQPERVKYPTTPRRIDTSFMQPDMVLVPADISAFREQNPKVQITPDQWRVLTCVDGRNSLQMACQLLGLTPDAICVLAGELVAEGLIYVVPSDQVRIQVPDVDTQDLSTPDVANAYVAPGYTASSANPWSTFVPALPSTDTVPNPSTALPFETESQWGNGGNGATFVPGRGWITAPQTMQPLYSVGALASPSGIYAPVSSSRC